jgi:hypothetical protein
LARTTVLATLAYLGYIAFDLVRALIGPRSPTAAVDSWRLLDRVLALTMMPIVAFALYRFLLHLLVRLAGPDEPGDSTTPPQ